MQLRRHIGVRRYLRLIIGLQFCKPLHQLLDLMLLSNLLLLLPRRHCQCLMAGLPTLLLLVR